MTLGSPSGVNTSEIDVDLDSNTGELTIEGVGEGTDSFTIRVSNPDGSDTATFTITVEGDGGMVNRRPVWTAIPEQTVRVGETVVVDLSAYASDPDGDALTYSFAENDPSGRITVTRSGSVLTITGVSDTSDDILLPSITGTATDPGSLSASAEFGVTVMTTTTVNQPPAISTPPSSFLTIAPGGSLTLNLGTWTTDDRDSDADLDFDLDTPPTTSLDVTVTLSAANNMRIELDANTGLQSGDTFDVSWNVTDTDGASSRATWTITVQ